jgi:hypothetical protein
MAVTVAWQSSMTRGSFAQPEVAMVKRNVCVAMIGLTLVLYVGGCGQRQAASSPATSEAYVPGLGELMTLQQMRHAKLWFAGEAANWELADYELDELGEGFDDIVKYHPTHKESPVAPKDAIPRMIPQPLMDLRTAVMRKDSAAFGQSFDALTTACNNCHQATNFGFNRVQRPASNPYSNQLFEPPAGK